MNRNGKIIKLTVISVVNAIVLLLFCYFADNWRFSILTGPSVGQRLEEARLMYELSKDSLSEEYFSIPEEYLFVNIAYDRQLVTAVDEYGLPLGNIDITDRGKLNEFLSQLEDSHKYVILDVLLSKKYSSEADSALVQTILATDRIGIGTSSGDELIDGRLADKAGSADYSINLYETNFVKYEFLNDSIVSLPYKAFMELNPQETPINSTGPFHFHNGRFALKALTLKFPVKATLQKKYAKRSIGDVNMEEVVLLNLGNDILEMGIPVAELVKDKIVVIGDFTEADIHDTYLGKISGPVIHVNALDALCRNELEIPWWLIIFLLILYSGVTFSILMPDSYHKIIGRRLTRLKPKSSLILFILSFAGYTAFFTVVAVVIYLSADIDINVLIPSVWFTIMAAIKRYRKGVFEKHYKSI